jgi:hypothetical protein
MLDAAGAIVFTDINAVGDTSQTGGGIDGHPLASTGVVYRAMAWLGEVDATGRSRARDGGQKGA